MILSHLNAFKLSSVPAEDGSLMKNLPEIKNLEKSEPPKPDIPLPADNKSNEEVKIPEPPPVEQKTEETNGNLIKISESSLYRKYFKMLKVGIPAPAVKIKMNSEGLDPNLLDNPDLLIEKTPEDAEEEQ